MPDKKVHFSTDIAAGAAGVTGLRDYRINARKSLDDAEARWKKHLEPFFGALRAIDVTSSLIAAYVDMLGGYLPSADHQMKFAREVNI